MNSDAPMEQVPAWPVSRGLQAPAWYIDCFRNALRRVAVVLNSRAPYLTGENCNLTTSDAVLEEYFRREQLDRQLIQLNTAQADVYANDDEYSAEHFFYSSVDFPRRKANGGLARVAKFAVPDTFLNWSYCRLHCPSGSPDDLLLSEFGGSVDNPDFVKHCASNYLVKNFWHNFVHREIQGISNSNYGEFGGRAREDSDFEADNLANVLLLASYGIPIHCRGRIGRDKSKRVRAIFSRNRCNLVFAERAMHRIADRAAMSDDERWEELEWRFCRGVSNAVSMELIAHGLAAPSLRIFFNGKVNRRKGPAGDRRWREGTVIVEVAGYRINTQLPPYIPDDELRWERPFNEVAGLQGGSERVGKRLAIIRANRRAREAEIASVIRIRLGEIIRDRPSDREALEAAWYAVCTRIAVSLQSTKGEGNGR